MHPSFASYPFTLCTLYFHSQAIQSHLRHPTDKALTTGWCNLAVIHTSAVHCPVTRVHTPGTLSTSIHPNALASILSWLTSCSFVRPFVTLSLSHSLRTYFVILLSFIYKIFSLIKIFQNKLHNKIAVLLLNIHLKSYLISFLKSTTISASLPQGAYTISLVIKYL